MIVLAEEVLTRFAARFDWGFAEMGGCFRFGGGGGGIFEKVKMSPHSIVPAMRNYCIEDQTIMDEGLSTSKALPGKNPYSYLWLSRANGSVAHRIILKVNLP